MVNIEYLTDLRNEAMQGHLIRIGNNNNADDVIRMGNLFNYLVDCMFFDYTVLDKGGFTWLFIDVGVEGKFQELMKQYKPIF